MTDLATNLQSELTTAEGRVGQLEGEVSKLEGEVSHFHKARDDLLSSHELLLREAGEMKEQLESAKAALSDHEVVASQGQEAMLATQQQLYDQARACLIIHRWTPIAAYGN